MNECKLIYLQLVLVFLIHIFFWLRVLD